MAGNRTLRRGATWRRSLAAVACLGLLACGRASAAEAPMHIVGSTFLAPLVGKVVDRLVDGRIIVPPRQAYGGTVRGAREFCRSVGADTPSVVAMSRRMRVNEFEACVRNGVRDIVEIQLGLSALVLAARRDDGPYPLTLSTFYKAVANDIPRDDDFYRNTFQRWREIDEALPDAPIRVLVPASVHGSRGFFEDRFLEGACRGFTELKNIFAAKARVQQCVALREDGAVVEIGAPFVGEMRRALADAPKGTVAVMPVNMAMAMSDTLAILPIDGVPATHATMAARVYPFTRPLFVYVKKRHVKDAKGRGPVAGLRELITELTRERTIGPDGYLADEGLVPLDPVGRAAMRHQALRLTNMER